MPQTPQCSVNSGTFHTAHATLAWMRCTLYFTLLRSSIQSIRGVRSSRGCPQRQCLLPCDLAVSETGIPILFTFHSLIFNLFKLNNFYFYCFLYYIFSHFSLHPVIEKKKRKFFFNAIAVARLRVRTVRFSYSLVSLTVS